MKRTLTPAILLVLASITTFQLCDVSESSSDSTTTLAVKNGNDSQEITSITFTSPEGNLTADFSSIAAGNTTTAQTISFDSYTNVAYSCAVTAECTAGTVDLVKGDANTVTIIAGQDPTVDSVDNNSGGGSTDEGW